MTSQEKRSELQDFYVKNPAARYLPSGEQPASGWITRPNIKFQRGSDNYRNEREKTEGTARSFIAILDGVVVREDYYNQGKVVPIVPGSATSPERESSNVHSASKSILNAIVGIALRDQLVSENDPIAKYLPGVPDGKGAITISHLLNTASGLDWKEDSSEYEVDDNEDWVRAILDRGQVEVPGRRWKYSTGDTHLLASVLRVALERHGRPPLEQYAQAQLFAPLGIKYQYWHKDNHGTPTGGCNLFLTARALTRFGQLYLADGRWGDQPDPTDRPEVVPTKWVAKSRTCTYVDSDGTTQYGWLWWHDWAWNPADKQYHRVHFAQGHGGQSVVIMPCLKLVVSTIQQTWGKYDDNKDRFIYPATFAEEYVLLDGEVPGCGINHDNDDDDCTVRASGSLNERKRYRTIA